MKKKLLFGLGGLVVLAVAAAIILPQTLLKPKPVHIHAGFQVYKDESLQDFSDFKYMHEMPCTVDGKPIEGAHIDEQLEKAHLHDENGDVVHVHRKGALWRDLFTNIKYPISEDAVAYSNGKKVENILDKEIAAFESVVFFEGKHTKDQELLKKAVTKERITEIENSSEYCAT
jgi:hypothetical protein